jgi:hypothetical protein
VELGRGERTLQAESGRVAPAELLHTTLRCMVPPSDARHSGVEAFGAVHGPQAPTDHATVVHGKRLQGRDVAGGGCQRGEWGGGEHMHGSCR